MKVYIITGTSRGIGEALAQRLITEENGNRIYCISRTKNPRLQVQSRMKNVALKEFEMDLADLERIREVMKDIFRDIPSTGVEFIALVNNAGSIRPVRSIGHEDAEEQIAANVQLNLLAPMLISDAFIRVAQNWDCKKRILNLSSGAAKRPIQGWSAYCAAKSGLEMFTRCINEEQVNKKFPIHAVAFAPGVVNTEMQAEIRNSDKSQFPEIERFIQAKEKGELLDPHFVAQKIESFLGDAEFGKEIILHINQL